MKMRTGLLACLIVLLGGYAVSARNATPIAVSPDISVVPPSLDLTPELAAFSGVWESSREEVLPSGLIIEEVHPNWATVVYTWTDHPTAGLKAGWMRVRANVLPGGKLRWGFPGRLTVELTHGGSGIEGKREQAGRVSTFTMKKVGQLAAQRP
jgi:hypothetical protein